MKGFIERKRLLGQVRKAAEWPNRAATKAAQYKQDHFYFVIG